MKRLSLFLLCAVLLCAGLCGCEAAPAASGDARPVEALPPADAQTVTWALSFPAGLTVTSYQMPELVSPEAFAWGEYSPWVSWCNGPRAPSERHDAFLGGQAADLAQGEQLYAALNNRYKTVYTPLSGTYAGCDLSLPEYADLKQRLFESRVIFCSPDLSRVVSFGGRYLRASEETADLRSAVWKKECNIYQNGQLTFSYQSPDEEQGSFGDGWNTIDAWLDWPVQYACHFLQWRTDEYLIDRDTDQETRQNVFSVYALKENRMLYRFTEPFDAAEIDGYSVTFDGGVKGFDGRYVLIAFDGIKRTENETDIAYFQTLYALDLQTGEWRHLEDFAFTPALSPDGAYLAYSDNNYDGSLSAQPRGFYVKNLTTGETAFFDGAGAGYHDSWAVNGYVHAPTLRKTIR